MRFTFLSILWQCVTKNVWKVWPGLFSPTLLLLIVTFVNYQLQMSLRFDQQNCTAAKPQNQRGHHCFKSVSIRIFTFFIEITVTEMMEKKKELNCMMQYQSESTDEINRCCNVMVSRGGNDFQLHYCTCPSGFAYVVLCNAINLRTNWFLFRAVDRLNIVCVGC